MSGNLIQQLIRHQNPWVKVMGLLIAVAAAIFGYNAFEGDGDNSRPNNSPSGAGQSASAPASPAKSGSKVSSTPSSGKVTKVNGYDQLPGVRLVDHRNNDGDSFFVRHGDDTFELRLYYVDTAEKYLSDRHQDQRDRVADQAKDFGLTVDLTVTLGLAAKKYVLDLLDDQPFTVYTNWERVYDGDRYHGFVEIPDPENPSEMIYLTELLVRKGLGRIHTRGEETPDGRSWQTYKDYLYSLEKKAKQAKQGAWAL